MFVHGREAIRRNSLMVNLTFYKNVLVISMPYYLAFWSGYSGQMIFEPFAYMCYNIIFTQLLLIFFQVLDFEYQKDGDDKDRLYLMKEPVLYKRGQGGAYFSMSQYLGWYFYGIFQGGIITYLCFYWLDNPNAVRQDGK